MEPIDLNLVRAFVAVHEAGSFSAAGERLGVPRSTVSRAVSALEASLGVVLFHRTTRKVTTSRDGLALYGRVGAPFTQLERSLQDVPLRDGTDEVPSGTLRVTTTMDIGMAVLAEAATRFTERYPDVSVEVRLTTQLVDLAKEGFDLAIRVAPGPRKDSTLVSRKVGEIRVQLYAAPSYIARRGEVQSLSEIASHDWITITGSPVLKDGTRTVHAKPRIIADDMLFCREALRLGAGIGPLPTFVADPDVAAGRLVRVLPRWVVYTGSAHIVLPTRKLVPRRVTAFRDLVVEMLRQRPMS